MRLASVEVPNCRCAFSAQDTEKVPIGAECALGRHFRLPQLGDDGLRAGDFAHFQRIVCAHRDYAIVFRAEDLALKGHHRSRPWALLQGGADAQAVTAFALASFVKAQRLREMEDCGKCIASLHCLYADVYVKLYDVIFLFYDLFVFFRDLRFQS